MKRLFCTLCVVFLFACGGGGGGGAADGGPTEDASSGEVLADQASQPTEGWVSLGSKAGKAEVAEVRAFQATGSGVFMTIKSPADAGLFMLQPANAGAGWAKLFEGVGYTLATDQAVYVGLFEGNAGALVQVPLDGTEALDLGFNLGAREIRAIVDTGSLLYLLSKDWENAEYHVNRGSAALMQWDAAGAPTNETALGFYTDGTTMLLMTVRNEVLGLGCYNLPSNAGETDAWTPCPEFPTHEMVNQTDPYSVNARIVGRGERLAAWFEILKTGQKSYEVQAGGLGGGWSIVDGAPADVAPTSLLLTDDTLYVAYLGGAGADMVLAAPADGGGPFEAVGDGLPDAANGKSGVVGLAESGGAVYAAYFEYNAGGSTVTPYILD